jgi:hypothetical protein
MREIVGQPEVFARLEIAIDSAAKRGEPLGHILFDGPSRLISGTFDQKGQVHVGTQTGVGVCEGLFPKEGPMQPSFFVYAILVFLFPGGPLASSVV